MKLSTTLAAITFSLFAVSAWAQTPTINQRLENQRDREQAGVKDDQLTKGEATHLRADDAAIRAQEKVYRRANDGKLTKGEKKQLNKELNRNSRKIYRDRHNNRTPKS
ncbi:MAG TPA: hypothetical protein VFA59_06685 [Vicinamibacterales bacterium]|nr:hypothetical protein [Vicinamibacterales bacterium]